MKHFSKDSEAPIKPAELPKPNYPADLHPWWVSGYCAFASSLSIVFGKDQIISFRFTSSGKSEELELFNLLRQFFGGHGVFLTQLTRVNYVVSSFEGVNIVIEHFTNFPFLSFNDEVCALVDKAFIIRSSEKENIIKPAFNGIKQHIYSEANYAKIRKIANEIFELYWQYNNHLTI